MNALLTAKEVGDLLGVPVSWVYRETRLGRIPAVYVGRYRRYRMEAIEAWIETLEHDPASNKKFLPQQQEVRL